MSGDQNTGQTPPVAPTPTNANTPETERTWVRVVGLFMTSGARQELRELRNVPVSACIILLYGITVGAGAGFSGAKMWGTNDPNTTKPAQAPATAPGVPTGPRVRSEPLQGWGSPESQCWATVHGNALRDFEPTHRVVIACGLVAPGDKYEDRRMTVSDPFTIRPGLYPISVPYGETMRQGVAEIVKAGRAKFSQQYPNAKEPPIISFKTWTAVALLPKGVESRTITRLSDIRRLGGMIVKDNYLMPSCQ